jgi:F0F1-type ATP synthase beta subunit
MQPLDLPPGRVISVRGSVVDVRFAPPLPTRYRELRTGPEGEIVLEVASLLAEYEELKDIIAMLGEEELSRQDRATVSKARRLERFLTQPFYTTEHFTGHPASRCPWSRPSPAESASSPGSCAAWTSKTSA